MRNSLSTIGKSSLAATSPFLQQTTDSELGQLQAFSSPTQYLDFVLTRRLSQSQAREVLFSFIAKFGAQVPRPLAFINIDKDMLVSLIAQTANNWRRVE